MLNEERVKLMTRMASYESTEGKKNEAVANHFRSDYVGLQVLKAVICATFAYMIVFGVYIYYNFEELMLNIYRMDLWEFAVSIIKTYAAFVISYSLLVYIAFTIKYSKAKQNLKRYFNNLKLLSALYAEEKKKEQN